MVPPSAFPANSSYALSASVRLAAQQGGQDLAAATSGWVALSTPPPDTPLPGIGMALQLPYRALHPGQPLQALCASGFGTDSASGT